MSFARDFTCVNVFNGWSMLLYATGSMLLHPMWVLLFWKYICFAYVAPKCCVYCLTLQSVYLKWIRAQRWGGISASPPPLHTTCSPFWMLMQWTIQTMVFGAFPYLMCWCNAVITAWRSHLSSIGVWLCMLCTELSVILFREAFFKTAPDINCRPWK